MRRIKLLVSASLAIGGPSAIAAAPQHKVAAAIKPADAAEIRSLIGSIFGRYHRDRWDNFPDARIFAPSTLAIKTENARLTLGEAGDIDVDVFLDAQDNGEITTTSVTLAPAANGMVTATVVFNDPEVQVHGHVKRLTLERTSAGWRVFDVIINGKWSYRAVMIREIARLSKGAQAMLPPASAAPARPMLPNAIQYRGFTGSERFPVFNNFRIIAGSGGILGGSAFMQIGIFAGDAPITGTYANGECTIVRKKQTFRGRCDEAEFAGVVYSASGKLGESFRFLSTAELARVQGGQPSAPASYDRSSPSAAAYSDAPPQALLVPSYGRPRILVEPGGRCVESDILVRGYCFGPVIGYLQQHPELSQAVAVTMTRSYLLGTWVPLNSGQGWNLYEVKRRDGGFVAERDRQFTTKVNPPQGCMPATAQDEGWLITTSQGYKVAAEAKHFLCDPARSSPVIASQAGHGLRDGEPSQSAYRSRSSYPQPTAAPSAVQSGPGNINEETAYHARAMMAQDDSGIITGSPSETTTAAPPRGKRPPRR